MRLYHYTDQNGFMGIVGGNELWATKIQYLNDNNEYQLAFKIAEKYIDLLLLKTVDVNEILRLKRFKANFGNISNLNVCVCSFSTEGDLLSQWRGYSNSLGGYSIGFDSEKLEKVAELARFELKPCIYDEREQKKLVHRVINQVLDTYKEYQEPYTEESQISLSSDSSNELCRKLAEISPIIKDASFKEEGEWRLISKGGLNYEQLDFRAGKSMLTPFYKIKLGSHHDNLITNVIVGHTPNLELAINATQAYLYKVIPNISDRPGVGRSQIPFRSW
ncbi:DUF2971 domain-containing protein [Vibrio parahaemolyticus]|nr:DUF2971 domain-containing protein [Vibrio parahaemolyticus]